MNLSKISAAALYLVKNPEKIAKYGNIRELPNLISDLKSHILISKDVKLLMNIPNLVSEYQDILTELENRRLELTALNISRTSPQYKEIEKISEEIDSLKIQIQDISNISKEDVLPLDFNQWSKKEKHIWSMIIKSTGVYTPYIVNLINEKIVKETTNSAGVVEYKSELDDNRLKFLKDLYSASKLLNTKFYTQHGYEELNLTVAASKSYLTNKSKNEFNLQVFEKVVDVHTSKTSEKEKLNTVLKGISVHTHIHILKDALSNSTTSESSINAINHSIEDKKQSQLSKFKGHKFFLGSLILSNAITLAMVQKLIDDDNIMKNATNKVAEFIIKAGDLETYESVQKRFDQKHEEIKKKKEVVLANVQQQSQEMALKNNVEIKSLAKESDELFSQIKKFGYMSHGQIKAGVAKDNSYLSKTTEFLSLNLAKTGTGNLLLGLILSGTFLFSYQLSKQIRKGVPKAYGDFQNEQSSYKLIAGTYNYGFDEKSTFREIRKYAAQNIILSAIKEKKMDDSSVESRADVALMALIAEKIINLNFSINERTLSGKTYRELFLEKFSGTDASNLIDKIDSLKLEHMVGLSHTNSIFFIKNEIRGHLNNSYQESLSLKNLSVLEKYIKKDYVGSSFLGNVAIKLQESYPVKVDKNTLEMTSNVLLKNLSNKLNSSTNIVKPVYLNNSLENSDIKEILENSVNLMKKKDSVNYGVMSSLVFLTDKKQKEELGSIIHQNKNYNQKEKNMLGYYLYILSNNNKLSLSDIELFKDELNDKDKLLNKIKEINQNQDYEKLKSFILSDSLSDTEKNIINSFVRLNATKNKTLKLDMFEEMSNSFSQAGNNMTKGKELLMSFVHNEIEKQTKEQIDVLKKNNSEGMSVQVNRDINKGIKNHFVNELKSLGLNNASLLVDGVIERPIKTYRDVNVVASNNFTQKCFYNVSSFFARSLGRSNMNVVIRLNNEDLKENDDDSESISNKPVQYASIVKTLRNLEHITKKAEKMMNASSEPNRNTGSRIA